MCPLNLGLAMAKRHMQDTAAWQHLVATATSVAIGKLLKEEEG